QTMVLLKLCDTLAQSPEGQPVRRQNEGGRGKLGVPGKRIQEKRERTPLRLVRPDADVRRYLGEHHVARDQNTQLLAVERSVLGRVSVAHDDLPRPSSDSQLISFLEAPVLRG